MNKANVKFIFLLLLLHVLVASAQTLKIRLHSNLSVTSAIFTPLAGDYKVYLDSVALNLDDLAPVFQLTPDGEKIEVKSFEKSIGKCSKITFRAYSPDYSFKLKTVKPEVPIRSYEGDLEVYVLNKSLVMINHVNIERYVGGVAESEAGKRQSLEYYKLQTTICRTYALSNLRKHEAEGFNLCDQVHCQAYYSRTENPIINKALIDTRGQVIVDNDLNLISAAFHSNCGGQTMNSEDVWLLSASYLRSVKDTFCFNQPHAVWQKKIAKADWLKYLSLKHKYPVDDSVSNAKALTFPQNGNRAVYFADGNLQIPLKQLRADWQLKSTYFSIEERGDTVSFIGRGYGHGVGMCQEGAMRMAELGYSYKNIIGFYYTAVHLVDLTLLSFFRDE